MKKVEDMIQNGLYLVIKSNQIEINHQNQTIDVPVFQASLCYRDHQNKENVFQSVNSYRLDTLISDFEANLNGKFKEHMPFDYRDQKAICGFDKEILARLIKNAGIQVYITRANSKKLVGSPCYHDKNNYYGFSKFSCLMEDTVNELLLCLNNYYEQKKDNYISFFDNNLKYSNYEKKEELDYIKFQECSEKEKKLLFLPYY